MEQQISLAFLYTVVFIKDHVKQQHPLVAACITHTSNQQAGCQTNGLIV